MGAALTWQVAGRLSVHERGDAFHPTAAAAPRVPRRGDRRPAHADEIVSTAGEREALEGLHIIQEHARHAGHADILREQIDGATGD
jgi:hypothetical protein